MGHEAWQRAAARLRAAGVASPEAEARRMIERLTGEEGAALLLRRPLGAAELGRLEEWLERRERGEPLQHILGTAPFYGLELEVGPGALIPRPETERLVELALELVAGTPAPLLVDVGTGSGAIALALKNERPDATVVAADISPVALELAGSNALRLGLDVRFLSSDLLEAPALRALVRRTDLLVANPPYLPEADREVAEPEVRHDPPEALYAGPDGLLFARRLMAQARQTLRPGARLLLELDPRNVGRAAQEAAGWRAIRVERDLVGRERFLLLER